MAAIPDTTSGSPGHDDRPVLSCSRQWVCTPHPSASVGPPARPPVHSLQGPADAEQIWQHAITLPAQDAIHWLMTLSFDAERDGDALGVARLRRMRRTVQQARLEQLTVIDLLTSDRVDEVISSALENHSLGVGRCGGGHPSPIVRAARMAALRRLGPVSRPPAEPQR